MRLTRWAPRRYWPSLLWPRTMLQIVRYDPMSLPGGNEQGVVRSTFLFSCSFLSLERARLEMG
jgi:hypothetical protein